MTRYNAEVLTTSLLQEEGAAMKSPRNGEEWEGFGLRRKMGGFWTQK